MRYNTSICVHALWYLKILKKNKPSQSDRKRKLVESGDVSRILIIAMIKSIAAQGTPIPGEMNYIVLKWRKIKGKVSENVVGNTFLLLICA